MPGMSAPPSEPPAGVPPPPVPAEALPPAEPVLAGVCGASLAGLAAPELLGVANGWGTVPCREAGADGVAEPGADLDDAGADVDGAAVDVDGAGVDGAGVDPGVLLAGLVPAGAEALARGDGAAVGVESEGEVALAAGLGLAWRGDALARGCAAARGWLAGWDWVAPCGWDLGLVAAAAAS